MNYLLHKQRSPGAVVPIPEGLREMMEEISREVLRAQPPDVISFVADLLEEKLVNRENRSLAEKVVDNVLDYSLDIVAMLETTGIDRERAEAAMKRIHEEFHRHFETKTDDERLRDAFRERTVLERLVKECRFSEAEARKASAIIEQAYRTYYFRNAYKSPQPAAKDKDWRQAAKHTLSIYAQCGPTRQEMEVAARRIHTAYRAYYTRKREQMDHQATIIQRAFRSHRERKELRGFAHGDDSTILTHEVLQPADGDSQSDSSFSANEEIMRLIKDTVLASEGNRSFEQVLPTMDPDAAATLIQSAFRGHHKRIETGTTTSRPAAVQDPMIPNAVNDAAATVLQSTFRGHMARKKMQQEATHHQMATLLQSHARGYLARRRHGSRNDPAAQNS